LRARVVDARARPEAGRDREALGGDSRNASRPEMAPQALENAQNARGNGAPLSPFSRLRPPAGEAGATPGLDPEGRLSPPPTSGSPHMAPQLLEKPRFAEGNGAPV